MSRLYFEVYGCTMNQAEGELALQRLVDLGHVIVDDPSRADHRLIFTCTVIETTERRMLSRIDELRAVGPTLVCGCLPSAQIELLEGLENVMAVPIDEYQGLPAVLSFDPPEDVDREKPFIYDENDLRASIPIASGCKGACSYCITKLARPNLVSSPPEEIMGAMERMVGSGVREVRLSAQDAAVYGQDIGTTLPDLIRYLTALDGDHMIRIGMMNPDTANGILDDLLDAYSSTKVYRFLHLPAQSGSQDVLDSMGRKYRTEGVVRIVRSFRERYPELTLSTDVIVGYPTETDDDLELSVELVECLEPDILNITRFSARPGTRAAELREIPGWRIKERSRRMTDVHTLIASTKNRGLIGRELEVLTLRQGHDGATAGRTINYKPVSIEADLALGRRYKVEIVDANQTYLTGRVS